MDINELATQSIGTRKDTEMAFDTILKIIKQSESLNDVAIDEYKNLYAFFSPPAKAKKDKWAWMHSFCHKDYAKPLLKYVWGDGDYIFATDGFILVRSINYLNLEPGIYDKNKTKLNKDIQTPDANIIFERFDFSDAQLFTDELKQKTYMDYKTVRHCYYFDSIQGYVFDKKLYDRATAYTGLVDTKYHLGEERTPLVIGTPDLCVAIMPRKK